MAGRPPIHGEAGTTGGVGRSVEYHLWDTMIQRCTNPRHKSWKNYGGRGISVCDRWRRFENFIADMGRRPSAIHSLDRFPNGDGNYEPGNVRWATPKEQARTNRGVFRKGENNVIRQRRIA